MHLAKARKNVLKRPLRHDTKNGFESLASVGGEDPKIHARMPNKTESGEKTAQRMQSKHDKIQ